MFDTQKRASKEWTVTSVSKKRMVKGTMVRAVSGLVVKKKLKICIDLYSSGDEPFEYDDSLEHPPRSLKENFQDEDVCVIRLLKLKSKLQRKLESSLSSEISAYTSEKDPNAIDAQEVRLFVSV